MKGDFRLGTHLVRPSLNEISGADGVKHLEPKLIQVLVYLAERAGEVVSKEQILASVWAGVFVTDDVLTRGISELRRALGDDAREPQYIQTITKKGYRLIAPVGPLEEPAPSPNGQPDPAPSASASRPTSLKRFLPVAAVAGISLLVLLAYIWWKPARDASPEESIVLAVLPFENLSGSRDQDYFSDGLTEEMITELGHLRPDRLRVIARTSALQYKGSRKGIRQIAHELRAKYVIEGSVRREGGRIRITVQLIQASDETHLWAESYDRELSGVLAMQSEVAQSVARKTRIALSERQELRLARRRALVPRAHEAYLRGRFLLNERTPADLKKAAEFFRLAIAEDAAYAQPYAGLADALILLTEYGDMPPREAMPQAEKAALKALELDDGLAEAHSSLGMYRYSYEWNWKGAESEFLRAIALNPSYTTAHHWYANLLSSLSRYEEAGAQLQRVSELDSFSTIERTALAWRVYGSAGRFEDGIREARAVIEIEPNYGIAYRRLGLLYLLSGKREEGLAEIRRGMPPSQPGPLALADLGYAYAFLGQKDQALKILGDLELHAGSKYVDASRIALIYMGLGDGDRAIEWLRRGLEQRDMGMLVLRADPRFATMRTDPRFQAILRSVGLPE